MYVEHTSYKNKNETAGHRDCQITDWNQFLRDEPWEVFHIKASHLSPPSSHIGSLFKLALPGFASAVFNPPES